MCKNHDRVVGRRGFWVENETCIAFESTCKILVGFIFWDLPRKQEALSLSTRNICMLLLSPLFWENRK